MTNRHESVLLHFFVRTFLVPAILLFSVYVLVHGEASPGGGFQGGAIFAAGIILARLSLGTDSPDPLFSRNSLVALAALGVAIFALTGLLPLAYGAAYLDYGAIGFDQIWIDEVTRRKVGIFVIEGGIAIAVFATLTLLFDYLTVREPEEEEN